MKVLEDVLLKSDARNPQINNILDRDMMKYTVVRRIILGSQNTLFAPLIANKVLGSFI